MSAIVAQPSLWELLTYHRRHAAAGLARRPGRIPTKAATVTQSLVMDDLPAANAVWATERVRTAYTGAIFSLFNGTTTSDFDNTSGVVAFAGGGTARGVNWYDQSGNTRTITQATDANRANICTGGALITQGTSATPVFRFDGTNDRFSRADACGLSGSPALTIAMAMKRSVVAPQQPWSFGADAGNTAIFPSGGAAVNATKFSMRNNSSGTRFYSTVTSIANWHYMVFTKAASGNIGVLNARQNGSLLAEFSLTDEAFNLSNSITSIGSYLDGSGCEPIDLSFFALWTTVLTAPQITTLETYLASRM